MLFVVVETVKKLVGTASFLGWFDATAGSLLMANSMFYRAALDGL
jgi:hypothetical protein